MKDFHRSAFHRLRIAFLMLCGSRTGLFVPLDAQTRRQVVGACAPAYRFISECNIEMDMPKMARNV